MLFVKRYTGDGLLPFKLQAMEVDELDSSTIIARHKSNRVCGGIEYTPYNKPVGYWFRQYSIDGVTAPEPVYIDAKDVIFYFSKRRPSAGRPHGFRGHRQRRVPLRVAQQQELQDGHLLGARAEMLEEENNLLDLMAGILHIHIYITPPSPAQEIDFTLEYDINYVQSALAA